MNDTIEAVQQTTKFGPGDRVQVVDNHMLGGQIMNRTIEAPTLDIGDLVTLRYPDSRCSHCSNQLDGGPLGAIVDQDTAWIVTLVDQSFDHAGRSRLICTADELTLADTAEVEDGGDEEDGADRLRPATKKILTVLTESGLPLSVQGIGDAVASKYGHGLTRPTISKGCADLVSRGLADELDQGQYGTKFWQVTQK